MDDPVGHGDAEQHHDHNVADAAHRAAASDVIPWQRRKNSPSVGRTKRRFLMAPMSRFGRLLKPKSLQKVAGGEPNGPKKIVRRRGTRRDTRNRWHDSHLGDLAEGTRLGWRSDRTRAGWERGRELWQLPDFVPAVSLAERGWRGRFFL